MKIQTSTCHICLEELSFDFKDIKKKCCPTKAFICNNCWEKLLENKDIIKCPLCYSNFDIEMNNDSDPLIESEIIESNVRINKIKNYFLNFLMYLIVGMVSCLFLVYLIHSKSTTFEKELTYLISSPFQWIMSPIYGYFVISLFTIIYICFERLFKTIVNYDYSQRQKDIFKMILYYISFTLLLLTLGFLSILLIMFIFSEDINDFETIVLENCFKLDIISIYIFAGILVIILFIFIRDIFCKRVN